MRIVSVKYSSPNSVSGRFPGFDRAILAKSFPAYAYFAASAPSLAMDGSLGEINTLDTENIKMFLRLYDTGTTVLICFFYDCFFFHLFSALKNNYSDSVNWHKLYLATNLNSDKCTTLQIIKTIQFESIGKSWSTGQTKSA